MNIPGFFFTATSNIAYLSLHFLCRKCGFEVTLQIRTFNPIGGKTNYLFATYAEICLAEHLNLSFKPNFYSIACIYQLIYLYLQPKSQFRSASRMKEITFVGMTTEALMKTGDITANQGSRLIVLTMTPMPMMIHGRRRRSDWK